MLVSLIEVMCTEIYTKGSAIIELLELWEHIVCMCICILCVCMCACIKSKRKEQLTYTKCIKQKFPSVKERKKDLYEELRVSSLFFQLYHNILCRFICKQDIWTINTPNVQSLKYNSLLTIMKLTKQTSLTTYWHQSIKMTMGSYYNKNKYV